MTDVNRASDIQIVKWACARCEKVCGGKEWPTEREALCLDCALVRQAANDNWTLQQALVTKEYDAPEVLEALVRSVYQLCRASR